MPAGVSWGTYIKFTIAAFASMTLGAQIVHIYYKPLSDLDVYIEREYSNMIRLQNRESPPPPSSSF